MGNESGFYGKEIQLNNYNFSCFDGNSNYLILGNKNQIKIFNLKSNNKYPIVIEKENTISLIRIHPRIKTIFLSVLNDNIIIWEIKQSKNECKEKIIIKGHTKIITKAVFCKTNDKLLASSSEDKTIKIWLFERYFCIANIQTTHIIYNIVLFNEYIYYQNKEESITIYNINELREVKTIKNEVDDFIIKDINTIIIRFENKLKFYSKTQIKKITFVKEIKNMFYDEQLNILYLFLDKVLLLYEPTKKNIITKFDFSLFNLIFIDNIINSNFIFGNFLLFNDGSFYIYSFYSKKIYDENKIIQLSFPKDDFWDRCISSISNNDSLSWNENDDFLDDEIFKKNYLNDQEIEKELSSNFNIKLKDKKNQVENILKNYEENNEIEMNYYKLIKLIIKDNTNKNLIVKYLHFLEKIDTKFQVFENFQKEYEYYRIVFTNEELIKYKFNGNKVSERELFFDLINTIITLNINKMVEKNKFYEEIKTKLKTIQIFNQPIEFTNEELYWYRNRIIIYFSLKKILSNSNIYSFFQNFTFILLSFN